MSAKLWIVASLVAIAPACATDNTEPSDSIDADPSDFDAKADGISGSAPAVLSLIDNAKDRLLVQMPTLTDKTLLTHLQNAAARGVDVHAYLVVPHAAHPATVLAAEQLEAAGVDTIVERTTQLAGFLAIGDDKMLVKTGATYKTVTGADVTKFAAKFTTAIAEDVSGSAPALGSDQTGLILMPDDQAGPIVALINGATTSIDLEIYQLQSPAVIAALEAAKQRGVAVRVMLEPRTVGFKNFNMVKAHLERANVLVQETPPAFNTHHNVDHAKFMVLDGRELTFGSGNMTRSGLGGNPATEFDNRDFWIRDRRSGSVAEAKKLFDADWNRSSTTSTAFASLVLTPDNANDRVIKLIDNAHTRLYVYNQSLNDSNVTNHLISAKQRGVDVHVLLGNQPGFGGAPPANQPAIDALTAAHATAGYFTTQYLHGKVIVADGNAFVGSQNFTAGGLGNNRELGEILTSPAIVDGLARNFTADEMHASP